MDAILARRSIRKYTRQPVPDEVLKDLLRAAMAAPSAYNEQPWHFVVIKDRKILDRIPEFHPYAGMLKETTVAILVCGDTRAGKWVPMDCAAATENILIAAQDKGLGAVWVAAYPDEKFEAGFRNLMGIPNNMRPIALIPIGYPAEQKPPANHFDPARIHYDRW